MIIRATVANLGYREAAQLAQQAGLSGTVYPSMGFGEWGVETGATFEFAGQDPTHVREFVVALLRSRHEQAAYVVTLGREAGAVLVHADERQPDITLSAAT